MAPFIHSSKQNDRSIALRAYRNRIQSNLVLFGRCMFFKVGAVRDCLVLPGARSASIQRASEPTPPDPGIEKQTLRGRPLHTQSNQTTTPTPTAIWPTTQKQRRPPRAAFLIISGNNIHYARNSRRQAAWAGRQRAPSWPPGRHLARCFFFSYLAS